MPSKQRKKLKTLKNQYAANADTYKQRAQVNYKQNAEAVVEKKKLRNASDVTYRKKHLEAQKHRLSQNESHREKQANGQG